MPGVAHGYEQMNRKRILPAATPRLAGEEFSY